MVKNLGLDGEKTSFRQNSRAGRDLCFTGTDLLEFLGFLKNSSLQVIPFVKSPVPGFLRLDVI